MTGSTIERSPRTTSVSAYAGSGGLRSRYTTLAVRGLIVAGFAGAAWLMSSSAAHASEVPFSVPQGTGVWGLLGGANHEGVNALFGDGDTVSSLVDTLGSGNRVDGHGARTADVESDRTTTDTVLWSATDLLTSVVPVSSTIPVQDLARRHGTADGPSVSHLLTGVGEVRTVGKHHTGTGARKGGVTATAPRSHHTRKATSTARAAGGAVLTASTGGPATAVAAGGAGSASEKDLPGKDGAVTRRAATRHHVGGGTTSAGSKESSGSQRTRHVPLLPRPAPDPAIPGAGLTSGVPGMGSGLSQDGGAPAVVPAITAASSMAGNRPETAQDVEVRALIAESPTFSPD
jgi:hypothetical protein